MSGQFTVLFGGNGDDDIRPSWAGDSPVRNYYWNFLRKGLYIDGLEGNDTLGGGLQNDYIDGNVGNDVLFDNFGNDTVMGGLGDDRFIVDAGNDYHEGGPGIDTVDLRNVYSSVFGSYVASYAGVRIDLASTSAQDLGPLGIDHFVGFENAWGTSGSDSICGNADANSLHGGDAGNDILMGRSGADTLVGGRGADTVAGGIGADVIYAGFEDRADGSCDIIQYAALDESGTAAQTRDVIHGFVRGQDRIDLSRIDANPFKPGDQAFKVVQEFTSVVGEVRIDYSKADTIIAVDGDQDFYVDMTIFVRGVHLGAADLLL